MGPWSGFWAETSAGEDLNHMWFFTVEQARRWCEPHQMVDTNGAPNREPQGFAKATFVFGEQPASLVRWITDQIVAAVGPWEEALLWLDPGNSWNRENLHLYYRLRQSYGDHNLLKDAPAHYFLSHEEPDLLSYLQVAILNEWDAFLFTSQDYGRAFLSRNGGVEIHAKDAHDLDRLAEILTSSGLHLMRN